MSATPETSPSDSIRICGGDGSSHTKRHLPEKIVYVETFESEAEAIKRERQIKKWSRAKKEALISGDMARLRELSKKRSERSA
jgi:putative endonuclease